jgi:hypothetical protein
VLKKEKNKITLVEVPYQNQLETRMMSYSRIIWIDLDVNNDENKKYLKKLLSKFKDLIFEATDDIDTGIES